MRDIVLNTTIVETEYCCVGRESRSVGELSLYILTHKKDKNQLKKDSE
jgi:hypothetical protein